MKRFYVQSKHISDLPIDDGKEPLINVVTKRLDGSFGLPIPMQIVISKDNELMVGCHCGIALVIPPHVMVQIAQDILENEKSHKLEE